MIRSPRPPANVRLALEGTRVVILTDRPDVPRLAGTISGVRTQTQLKPYLVTCDDGSVRFASGYDLAREDDVAGTPLAPPPTR